MTPLALWQKRAPLPGAATRSRAAPRPPDESDGPLLAPAGRCCYRRAFVLARAFPFGAAFFRAMALCEALPLLATGFPFAEP